MASLESLPFAHQMASLQPNMATMASRVRSSAALGCVPFSKLGTQVGSMRVPDVLKVMGLDIEFSLEGTNGGLPLSHSEITCGSMVTTYLHNWNLDDREPMHATLLYVHGTLDVMSAKQTIEKHCGGMWTLQYVRCKDSRHLACTMVETIHKECPDFLFVHNGLNFDFKTMAANTVVTLDEHSFSRVNIGSEDMGVTLVVGGVNVLDTYDAVYMLKADGIGCYLFEYSSVWMLCIADPMLTLLQCRPGRVQSPTGGIPSAPWMMAPVKEGCPLDP